MSRPKNNPDFVDKLCKLCGCSYKVSFYKRKKSTYCSKKCANSDVNVLNKMRTSQKNTYDKKYNGVHPMQTEETKRNLKASLLNKYGVESYSKLDEYKNKVKTTKLKNHGDENYINVEKIKQTVMSKYGVDNVMKLEDVKEKCKKTCIEKYGVEHYSKSIPSKNNHHDLTYSKILLFSNVTPLFSREEFLGVTKNIQYKFQCNRCTSIINLDLKDGNIPLCVKCDKLNTSFAQKEIFDFIKKYINDDVILNDRNLIFPKEIDIYVPSLKIGIEYNSFYYHTEITGNKNKLYHLRKLQSTLFKGINLIQIFENEWNDKKEIIQSILRNKLNSFDKKIFARKCVVKEIDAHESNQFLIQNHIQGKDHASIRLGLYYNNELISLMTFVKSRYDKKVQYEMSRFCNKLNHLIIGGASKLFKYFIKKYNPKSIVSYSDRRFFNGDVYQKLNFSIVTNTSPCYFYIKNKMCYNRMSFQKHKLEKILTNYNKDLTEWENMFNNGYDRIWDCGHSKWIYNSIST